MTVSFDIPLPPSLWTLYVRRKYGRGQARSKIYTSWAEAAGWEIRHQIKDWSCRGPWSLEIQAVKKDKRRRDVDNLIKPVADLLVSLEVVSDDSDMLSVTARWIPAGPDVPACKVSIIAHKE